MVNPSFVTERVFTTSRRINRHAFFKNPGKNCPHSGRLLLSGRTVALQVHVDYKDDEGKLKSYTHSIDLIYQRWWIEVGGSYALVLSGDEELVTRLVEPTEEGGEAMVQVLDRRNPSYSTDTGIMFTFYPGNYPSIGVGFGISSSADRAPGYYLGFSLRLRTIGKKAVASFHVGGVAQQLRTFPRINFDSEGDNFFEPGNPLLEGDLDYEINPFLGISLGFSIGNAGKQGGG